jgi:hypothetical protein
VYLGRKFNTMQAEENPANSPAEVK